MQDLFLDQASAPAAGTLDAIDAFLAHAKRGLGEALVLAPEHTLRDLAAVLPELRRAVAAETRLRKAGRPRCGRSAARRGDLGAIRSAIADGARPAKKRKTNK